MSERGEDFDQKREAYEAAHAELMRLCDNPDKTMPVGEYRGQLRAAEVKMLEAHEAMMAAWSAPTPDEPNEFAVAVAEVFAAAAEGNEPWNDPSDPAHTRASNVSDETVEALARRNFEAEQGTAKWERCWEDAKAGWRREARAQVEAIAPQLRAQALREAADAFELLPPKLKHQTVATLRLYADEPWRLEGSAVDRG